MPTDDMDLDYNSHEEKEESKEPVKGSEFDFKYQLKKPDLRDKYWRLQDTLRETLHRICEDAPDDEKKKLCDKALGDFHAEIMGLLEEGKFDTQYCWP